MKNHFLIPCSTCNSQIQRHRNADKKAQEIQIKENDVLDDSSNEKEVDDTNKKKEDLSNERELDDINKEDQIFSVGSSDSEEEEENNLIKTLFMSLINTCYLEPCEYNVSKSQKWWYNVLNTYNDNRFKI